MAMSRRPAKRIQANLLDFMSKKAKHADAVSEVSDDIATSVTHEPPQPEQAPTETDPPHLEQVPTEPEPSHSQQTQEESDPTLSEQAPEESDMLQPEVIQPNASALAQKKKFEHVFQSHWLDKYAWLRYSTGLMTCAICIESKKKNSMTTGCNNFRTSTICRHLESADHTHAVKEAAMRNNFKCATSKAISKETEAIVGAFRCAYWLAKEGLPLAKYSSLIDFCILQGCTALSNLHVGKNASYRSWQTSEQVLECIVDVIVADIDEQLKQSDFISVMIDESTDITVTKKLVIYGKTVTSNYEQHTFFLGNIPFEESHVNATLVVNKLREFMQSRGVQFSQVYGFGSDGASLMTGKKTGVATQIKDTNPHCVNVHCFAHRLALCTEKAAGSVSYINKTFNKTMTDLFYYFKKSTCRVAELASVQKILETDIVRVKEVHEVRWFAFYDALFAVYKSWKPLVQYFKKLKKPSEKEKWLLLNLTDLRFVHVMHLLLDILPAYTQLSMLFQAQNLDISAVPAALDGALNAAKSAKHSKGPYQKELNQKLERKDDKFVYKQEILSRESDNKTALKEVKAISSEFVEALVDNTNKRFPKESTEVVFAFKSFGLRAISYLTAEDVETYGNDDLDKLIKFYGFEQRSLSGMESKPLINPECTKQEWSLLKKVVLTQKYPTDSLNVLWKIISNNHSASFPNLLVLAKLGLVIPLQTADCERGFSCQNRILTPSRNRLKPHKVNQIMTIILEGPSVNDFDFSKAVKIWTSKQNRRILNV